MKGSQIKIVFTGSVGAGKSLAISQLSEIMVVKTEVKHSEAITFEKKTTTVGMDYGQVSLSATDKLHLYGTPGQRRFDFMSDILTKGALAIIIIINNSLDEPLNELLYYLELNKVFLEQNTAAIVITHMDVSDKPSVENYTNFLSERDGDYPVISIDLREKEQALDMLDEVMCHLALFHSL